MHDALQFQQGFDSYVLPPYSALGSLELSIRGILLLPSGVLQLLGGELSPIICANSLEFSPSIDFLTMAFHFRNFSNTWSLDFRK